MISVVVPIYKIENFLPTCIESLLAQTYSEIEIILVDDGSPDNCPKICDDYAKKFSNIKVIHKKNGGLVSARKIGVQMAKGDFIGYVDGDDWVEPEMFANLRECQKIFNADIVAAGFTKDIGVLSTKHFNFISDGFYDKTKLQAEIYFKMMYDPNSNMPGVYTYVWNKLFRKSFVCQKQMNIPNNIFIGEDAALTYPSLLEVQNLCITKNCAYHYRQRANSMLKDTTSFKNSIQGIKNLYYFLSNYINSNPKFQYLKEQMERYILFMLISLSGGVVLKSDGKIDFFCYDNLENNVKIVIYGAGTVGQHLYSRLKQAKFQNFFIVKWVDPDYNVYREHGLPVSETESLFNLEFDKIIIAMMDKTQIKKIREWLIEKNIPAEKISEINSINNLNISATLKKFEITPYEESLK